MFDRLALPLLILVAAGTASPGRAQQTRLELRAGQVIDGEGLADKGVTASGSVAEVGQKGWGRLTMEGTVTSDRRLLGSLSSVFGAATAVTGLGLALVGSASGTHASGGYFAANASLSPGLRIASTRWHAEAGPAVNFAAERHESGLAGDAVGPFGGRRPTSETRTWIASGFRVSGAARFGVATASGGWSISTADGASWRDLTGHLAVEGAGLSLALGAGTRSGTVEGELWGVARLAAAVSRAVELVAQAGRIPSDPLTARPGGTQMAVGVAVVTGRPDRPSGLGVPPRPAGPVEIRLNAKSGSTVELVAEWNDWKTVRALEVEEGVFAVRTTLQPGHYRFGFRVDGEWRLPSEFATEPDGYGGRNAVLDIRPAATGG